MDLYSRTLLFTLIDMLIVTTYVFATWVYPDEPPEGNLQSNSLYINFILQSLY